MVLKMTPKKIIQELGDGGGRESGRGRKRWVYISKRSYIIIISPEI